MHNKIINGILLALVIAAILSCGGNDGNPNTDQSDNIVYHAVNKEFVLITDVETLLQSDDEISNHVDSILSGLIDAEFVSTGHKKFDLDGDDNFDIGFEIIDLNKLNPQGLPEEFDSLAARVIPYAVEILDNSTYGYCDALDQDIEIGGGNYYTHGTCVLGTFLDAGQFKGKGEKYLGIRFFNENTYKYGWIKIYCSQHNDTLRIIEYAYNDIGNSPIKAGQKE